MKDSGWEKFNQWSIWMMRLAYANLLWVVFTLLGLIVVGLFPATMALTAVIRKFIQKEEVSIFQTFWTAFRSSFFIANGLGWFFSIAAFIFYVDYLFIQQQAQGAYLMPLFFGMFVVYLATLLFIFPVYVHYELSFYQTIKQSVIIALTNPLEVLLIMVSILVFCLLMLLLPGIIPMFFGSGITGIVVLFCLRAFEKVKHKEQFSYRHEKT